MDRNESLFDHEFKENVENGDNSKHSPNSFCLNSNERSIWSAPSVQPFGLFRQNTEPALDGWSRRGVPLSEIVGNGVNIVNDEKELSPEAPKRKISVLHSQGTFPSSETLNMKLSSSNENEGPTFKRNRTNGHESRRQSFDSGHTGPNYNNGPNRKSAAGNTLPSISGNVSSSNVVNPQPIASSPGPSSFLPASDPQTPVDLNVTSLDKTMNANELRRTLLSLFSECTSVLKMILHAQADGNWAAVVRVPSQHDAQYVISQFHRKRVGQKKIVISYSQPHDVSVPEHYKSHIKTLLSEVPYCRLPLSKFMELLESRYSISVAVSDLTKMKDTCVVTMENGLRMVSLVTTPSANVTFPSRPSPPLEIEPFCTQHFRIPFNPSIGWAEQKIAPLPNVNVSLSEFSNNVYKLLESHNDKLPLASFHFCYVETCGELNVCEEGIPLEHLVTCVKGVDLQTIEGVKFVRQASSDSASEINSNELPSCMSPSLSTSVSLFKAELVKFLKTQPRAQILFNKFIPGYHRHFSRQCRVADFGFTRLIDLLEALPFTVQVLGEGCHKIVTLAHQAQVRRFTSELQRVLKVQPMRKLPLAEIPEKFEQVLERPFNPLDYGLCSLTDLLSCVSSNTAVVVNEDGCEMVSLFSREQTVEEKRRTKIFAKEVVELFRLAAHGLVILFEKFVPTYHHHFGYQCRVSDYGYTRLIDLFEGIPEVVKIGQDEAGQRTITLTTEKRLEVLGEQIREIVTPSGLPVSYLSSAFLWQHGYSLKPEEYDEPDLESLVQKLPYVILKSNNVEPTEASLVRHICIQVRKFLIHSEQGVATPEVLTTCFSSYPQQYLRLKALVKIMPETVQISKNECGAPQLQLTPLYYVVRRIVSLLNNPKGHLPLSAIEIAYIREYKCAVRPQTLGFSGLTELLKVIPRDVWTLYGKGRKRLVVLGEGMLYREKRNSPQSTSGRTEAASKPQPAIGCQRTIERFNPWSSSDTVESERSETDSSASSKWPKTYRLFAERSSEGDDDAIWPPIFRPSKENSRAGVQPEIGSPDDKNNSSDF